MYGYEFRLKQIIKNMENIIVPYTIYTSRPLTETCYKYFRKERLLRKPHKNLERII